MKRKEIIKTRGYWLAKMQMDLYDQLREYMEKKSLNQTQLAKELGVSKGYVSQVLNGDFNHRLSTLVDLSLAIDKIPELRFQDLNQYIDDEQEGVRKIDWTISVNDNEKTVYNESSESTVRTVDTKFSGKTPIGQQQVNFS